MHRKINCFLFALLIVGLIAPTAWCQSVHSILSKLDQNYYYPQNQGLKSFSAQVQWELLDAGSGSNKFLRQPDFIFTWNQNQDAGLGSFQLAMGQGVEHRFEELSQQINPFRESIIPITLAHKFSDFEGSVQEVRKNQLLLKLNPRNGGDLSFKLLVHSQDLVINKLRFHQTHSRHSPEKVEGEFRYIKLEGKRALSESRSQFEIEGQEYTETTRYRYKKVEGIWWVHRIDQTIKRKENILQTLILRLSNFSPTLSLKP